jgi:hypothetical protein
MVIAIAGKLGVDEKIIRRRLRHLGWTSSPEPSLVFPETCPGTSEAIVEVSEHTDANNSREKPQPIGQADGEAEPASQSLALKSTGSLDGPAIGSHGRA